VAQFELLNAPNAEASRKADGAYKTISEVSDELGVPQHVLRFWESHFPQVKPSRMRGGRRYYRPEDIDLLRKIKALLYAQGYTIKGAKKVVKGKDEKVLDATARPASKKSKANPKILASELRVLKSMLNALL